MTHAPALRPQDPSARIIIVAARCWRSAHNRGAPIKPTLFDTLDRYRCGVLVPAIDSLMTLFEAFTGRVFRAGGSGARRLSADELRLLRLMAASRNSVGVRFDDLARPALATALRIAVQSTRILIGQAMPSAAV